MGERLHPAVIWQISGRVNRLIRSPAYDVAVRVPLVAWSSALALRSAVGLEQYLRAADFTQPTLLLAVEIMMRLAVIAYLVLLAITVIMRRPPVGRLPGMEPRISALIGTFLVTAVVLFPRRDLSPVAGLVSVLLILVGEGMAIAALMQLRRSFSIMPEARELTIAGPYRLVRHPLYLAEAIATIGSVMQFLSVWTLMLLVIQLLFQLRRVENEEAVLSEAFPCYAVYKKKTARLIPGIY